MTTLPPCPQCQSEYTYEDDANLVCPECAHEWSAQADAAAEADDALSVVDAHGTPLANDHLDCKDFKRVLINPEIVEESPERVTYEEGCLSFPGVHERVTRAERIRVKYLNERFEPVEEALGGFAARIVEHECEHLAGELFIDNISPIRRQLNKAKLNNIIKGKASCRYRIKPANKK